MITEPLAIVMIFPSWSLGVCLLKFPFFLLFEVNSGIEPQTSEFSIPSLSMMPISSSALLIMLSGEQEGRALLCNGQAGCAHDHLEISPAFSTLFFYCLPKFLFEHLFQINKSMSCKDLYRFSRHCLDCIIQGCIFRMKFFCSTDAESNIVCENSHKL